MAEYKKYTNSVLVDYFNSQFPHDTDRTDYAQYLLSMNDKYSIDDFVKIYNDILDKLLSYFYGDEDNRPSKWWDYSTISLEYSSKLKNLDFFFNQQLERLFDARKELNDKFIIECLVNLKPANNRRRISQRFIDRYTKSAKYSLYDVVTSMNELEESRKHISPYNIDTNEYIEYKDKYIENIKYLIKLGYKKSYRDVCFEIKTKISYLASIKSLLLILCIFIPVIAIVIFLFQDISIITIILIIGLPGALLSYLK